MIMFYRLLFSFLYLCIISISQADASYVLMTSPSFPIVGGQTIAYSDRLDMNVFFKQQRDGHLMFWKGHPDHREYVLWRSPFHTTAMGTDWFSKLTDDGRLVTYKGTPEHIIQEMWGSAYSGYGPGDYFLELSHDVSTLSIFKGTPDNRESLVWTASLTSPPHHYYPPPPSYHSGTPPTPFPVSTSMPTYKITMTPTRATTSPTISQAPPTDAPSFQTPPTTSPSTNPPTIITPTVILPPPTTTSPVIPTIIPPTTTTTSPVMPTTILPPPTTTSPVMPTITPTTTSTSPVMPTTITPRAGEVDIAQCFDTVESTGSFTSGMVSDEVLSSCTADQQTSCFTEVADAFKLDDGLYGEVTRFTEAFNLVSTDALDIREANPFEWGSKVASFTLDFITNGVSFNLCIAQAWFSCLPSIAPPALPDCDPNTVMSDIGQCFLQNIDFGSYTSSLTQLNDIYETCMNENTNGSNRRLQIAGDAIIKIGVSAEVAIPFIGGTLETGFHFTTNPFQVGGFFSRCRDRGVVIGAEGVILVGLDEALSYSTGFSSDETGGFEIDAGAGVGFSAAFLGRGQVSRNFWASVLDRPSEPYLYHFYVGAGAGGGVAHVNCINNYVST